MPSKKSWQDKLHTSNGLPKVERLSGKLIEKWGRGTLLIPAPIEVDELMRKVRPGKLTTIDEIRKYLAKKHGATMTCPMTTGIFAWIASHAADEAEREGKKRITPYWRTLKVGGELNPKYPGGIASAARKLRAEGHTVEQRGKRSFIVDFDKSLARLS